MNSSRAKSLEKQLAGQTIEGWTAEALINFGKSAAVFKAQGKDGDAAVKVLDPEIIDKHGAEIQADRIEREKTLIDKVHPHLVKIFGGGFWKEQQLFYVVMEFLASRTLQKYCHRCRWDWSEKSYRKSFRQLTPKRPCTLSVPRRPKQRNRGSLA